ncbi:unnamed protein product [Thelazia callipaeda]|uniref:Kunitz/Bovine pancreatic trypsin inhibitor domain protein n=1 Tax=Thelazia callipaeda TaxID=103827 RepID=A0A0N5CWB0_THECL|nr:unnamed protein product [Thelazia callipaeda]
MLILKCTNFFIVSNTTTASTTSVRPSRTRRLIIRTKYINDITTHLASSSSSSTPTTTTISPISLSSLLTTSIYFTPITTESSTSKIVNPTEVSLPSAPTTISEIRNPCLVGEPFISSNGITMTCNQKMEANGGCPEHFWCHIGDNYKSTVCCPNLQPEDRCKQSLQIGTGSSDLTRWYFNTKTKQCIKFKYKGLHGNANNFISQTECVTVCIDGREDLVNPCQLGQPAEGFNKKPLTCSGENSFSCPEGYFCHIGASSAETVCCKRSESHDICNLPKDEGQGSAKLRRYYYEVNSQKCKEFIYRGRQGNENNFLSYDKCKQKCIKVSEHQTCSIDNPDCGSVQWCHIGANAYSTLCCAGASANPCELPVALGEGNETLIRWFADPSDQSCSRECKSFVYKGFKGNQNNFLTKESCEKQCKRACENPCATGMMLLTSVGTPQFCSSSNFCPQNYWCHFGARTDTTVCCPESGVNPCDLPLVKGTGEESLKRWYFDRSKHQCVQFYYQGKQGNENSFLTEDDCKKTCPVYQNPCGTGEPFLINNNPKSCNSTDQCPATHYCHVGANGTQNSCCQKIGDPCNLPMKQGEGESLLLRYYYDKESGRCREFAYFGVKGNENNFLTEEACEAMCPVIPNPCLNGKPLTNSEKEPIICGSGESCPDNYFCHIGGTPETTNCCLGSTDACNLPLETGKGIEQLDRWYFDNNTQMCAKFTYYGLHGNANNFISRKECQKNCKEINPCGFGSPLTDELGNRIACNLNQSISCPSDYYCHIGSSPSTTECCPRQGGNPCELALSIGYGNEAIPRWYFNIHRQKCAEFVYGGMGGNENNFVSRKHCEEFCKVSQDYCPHGEPLMEASGKRLAKCGIDKACPVGFICNLNVKKNTTACCQDPANFCLQPMDSGPCDEFVTRYGYVPELDNCIEYQYGGKHLANSLFLLYYFVIIEFK